MEKWAMVKERVVAIPVDGSTNSERAFSWYVDNLQRDGDVMLCVHVVEPISLPVVSVSGGGGQMPCLPQLPVDQWQHRITTRLDAIEKLKNKYQSRMADVPGLKRGRVIVEEEGNLSIGGKLCQIILREGVQLIVLGNRGLGAIRRTVLGSVSEFILHHVRLPVVIVPKEHSFALYHKLDPSATESNQLGSSDESIADK